MGERQSRWVSSSGGFAVFHTKNDFVSKRAIRSPDNFAAEIEAAPGVHPARHGGSR